MDKEEIIDIRGWEGLYKISNLGFIYNKKGIRLTAKSALEYIIKGLYGKGKCKYFSVHRLVAFHFVDNPNNLEQVNHLDGVKQNNRADNLEWCTCLGNSQHAWETGLNTNKGEGHINSVYTEEDILLMRKLRDEGLMYIEIEEKTGFNKVTVGKICRKEQWKHI